MKKRVRLTREEKLRLLSLHEKNPKITQAKIGLENETVQILCYEIDQMIIGEYLVPKMMSRNS